MPKQDYTTAWNRHETAVGGVCGALQTAGLAEHTGPVISLPPFTYMKAPVRAVIPRMGIVPRDLVARLAGDPFAIKVYFTQGNAHSSLFRAVAYAMMVDPRKPYLQIVVGGSALPIAWLADLQGPLDHATPTGIHGEGAFLHAVEAAVTAHRNQLQNNP